MTDYTGFLAEPFYLTTAFAFVIMMMILLLMPQPVGPEWHPFRKSLHYMKMAFGIMTALNILQCLQPESEPHEYGLLVLVIAFYQALCFTMCFLRLLNPGSSLHKFIIHLVCVTAGAIVMLATHYLGPHTLCTIVFWLYLSAYIVTGLYYTWRCRKGWKECVARLAQYYDDDMADRMHWLSRLMWMVFAVGCLALLTSVWVQFNPFFVIAYPLAYAYFLVCIIRYAFNARFIVEVKTCEAVEQRDPKQEEKEAEETEKKEEPTPTAQPNDREQQLTMALQQWVEQKQYTQSDIAIEQTAHQLGTTYNFLSTYFQKHEGITFREWRTQLRVEEAKRLLREEASLSVSEVLEMSGFNDRVNFHRHFTRIVGCSPTAYRNREVIS